MATISKKELNELSLLNFMKYKTHPNLLGGVKQFIDPLPLSQFEIPESDDDIFHEVTIRDENRLDLISWTYYGNVDLWWIIAVVNNIFDPINELNPGDVLRIPSLVSVLESLRKFRKVELETDTL